MDSRMGNESVQRAGNQAEPMGGHREEATKSEEGDPDPFARKAQRRTRDIASLPMASSRGGPPRHGRVRFPIEHAITAPPHATSPRHKRRAVAGHSESISSGDSLGSWRRTERRRSKSPDQKRRSELGRHPSFAQAAEIFGTGAPTPLREDPATRPIARITGGAKITDCGATYGSMAAVFGK